MRFCIYFFLFFNARAPLRDLAFSICSKVGSCVSWSKATPPTDKHLATHRTADCPLSPALNTASTAKIALIAYTVPRPENATRVLATLSSVESDKIIVSLTSLKSSSERGREIGQRETRIIDECHQNNH